MLPVSSLLASSPYQTRWLDTNLPTQKTLFQPLPLEALLLDSESSIRLNFDILDRIQTESVYFPLGEAPYSLKDPKASLPTQ